MERQSGSEHTTTYGEHWRGFSHGSHQQDQKGRKSKSLSCRWSYPKCNVILDRAVLSFSTMVPCAYWSLLRYLPSMSTTSSLVSEIFVKGCKLTGLLVRKFKILNTNNLWINLKGVLSLIGKTFLVIICAPSPEEAYGRQWHGP